MERPKQRWKDRRHFKVQEEQILKDPNTKFSGGKFNNFNNSWNQSFIIIIVMQC